MEEKKRVEPMVIGIGDKEYTLEFNRETVDLAERSGFSREEAGQKMMVMLPTLFFFAFKMHHPSIKKDKTDDILFNKLKGLSPKEIERLTDLFDEPYNTLIHAEGEEDGDDERKNAGVTVRL